MPLNQEERDFLKRLYGRLTGEPLQPGDPLYEPLYDNPAAEDPIALMRTLIEFSPIESFQLFSGFRGTGKTTELFRLKRDLEQQGYFVVYADALDYVNPAEPVEISNLLIALAGAFSDRLEAALGANPAKETFWTSLQKFLDARIVVKEAGVKLELASPGKDAFGGAKAALDLKFELKSDPNFRDKLKLAFATWPKEFKDQVNLFFAEAIHLIRKVKGKDTPVVFIFDQLEQMRGTLESEEDVIRSVERIFSVNIDLLKIDYVHTIYTVPPWLKFRVAPQVTIRVLPTVHLWRNEAARPPDGPCRAAYRKLVERRLEPDGLRRLFGTDDDPVDRLIEMSGGQFRDMLRLLRETVLRSMSLPALPAPETMVTQAINAVRSDFLPIAQDDAKWLDAIGRNRVTALPTTEPGHVMRLARFLDTHSVLYFKNGDEWYDVHPLIRDEIAKVVGTKPA